VLNKIYKIIPDTYEKIEKESAEFKQFSEKPFPDLRVFAVAVVAAISLIFIEYIGKDPGYSLLIEFLKNIGLKTFPDFLTKHLELSGNIQLNRLAYWISIVLIFYLVVPILFIKLVFHEKLSDYGFRFGNLKKDYSIYLVMLVIMLPIVYMMSKTHSFQLRYPFYNLQSGEHLYPNFWLWEAMYFVQFVGVEFFFRGFMLHGTKRRLGFYSIIFMVVPYCMIHFGKPMAETVAAIVAGLALGLLSLKSKSIVPGILIHYSVAIAMDFAALYQKGYF
jgi:membrane protease YdiL (CAAX protease family)